MSHSLATLLQKPVVGGRSTLTYGNLICLAFVLFAVTQVSHAHAAAAYKAPSVGQSGFPVIMEGIVSWIKAIVGAGSAWGIYDKVGGGRDVGSTLKEAALPITGAALVAAPNVLEPFIGGTNTGTAGKASLMSLLSTWNFSFSQ